jgi:hypothetical protein
MFGSPAASSCCVCMHTAAQLVLDFHVGILIVAVVLGERGFGRRLADTVCQGRHFVEPFCSLSKLPSLCFSLNVRMLTVPWYWPYQAMA